MAAPSTEVVPAITSPEESSAAANPHAKIAELAYQLWLERGCPVGSDQDDWFRAEAMLNQKSEDVAEAGS